MDEFLNATMAELNNVSYEKLFEIRQDFINCLELWNCVLGDLAFRNPTLHNKGVSKALFDMLMTVASKMSSTERMTQRYATPALTNIAERGLTYKPLCGTSASETKNLGSLRTEVFFVAGPRIELGTSGL